MSKYIKLEDAIGCECPFMENWDNCINCPLYNGGSELCKMGKWLKSLPTIEVSEDCISREYLEEQLQQIEDITAMAHIDLGEDPYDETEEITMPISTVRKIFRNAPSVALLQDGVVMERLDFVKKVIETHIDNAPSGIFFTRNFVGDRMTQLDKRFGIEIEICYEYEYFEIFGLTDHEQRIIELFYDRLKHGEADK